MTAFNYRQLIRQIPPRAWQFYLQSRKIDLPPEYDWNMPVDKLVPVLVEAMEALDEAPRQSLFAELRRIHEMANRRGVDALRNVAPPNSALHEDFPPLSSDAERVLWAMINWPEIFDAAEAIYGVNLRIGKRGWKRIKVQSGETLFRSQEDIQALERALAEAFTPRKGTPRACQIDTLDRHLDGALQLGILIEDNAQRQLEFGEDNRTHWRDVRPPLRMDVVIHPGSGVIDVMVSGGAKARETVLTHLGKHLFRKPLQSLPIHEPMFLLNRLRDGFELFDDSQVDLAAHRVEHIRLSQARLRTNLPPYCDYLVKSPGSKEAPDVLACVKAHQLDHRLMSSGFNIRDATVSLYFLPTGNGKAGRVLHAELKQNGISNLRDMEEADARLVEALLLAWGVMQQSAAVMADGVKADSTAPALP